MDGFSLGSGASEHPADIETAGSPDLARDLEELPAAGRSYGNGIGGAMRRAFGEARATSSPGRRGPDSSRILKELGSATHLLDVLAVIQHEFVRDYESALGALRDTGLPAAVCTVYDAIPRLEPRYRTALSVFNDQIVKGAASAGLHIIDLRAICTEDTDDSRASPIEPSDSGGRKIAQAIARLYRNEVAGGRVAEIWT
ncbi:MAG: hypothetical protein GVY23_03810 [Spirochaetes bacterium]|nr:hypothetical protein [Spirochaetota bacterium]